MSNSSVVNEKVYSHRRELWICLFLATATIAIYWPVGNFDFINIDDFSYVTQNKDVQRGLSWENLKWAFQTRYAGNWHPLTTLSHMLDCHLFGLNAGAHHVTNLVFHLTNTLLVFVVLRRMTGAVWRSAIVAAFFALHPLHVESVAWVSERKDVLSGFFFLLTLWAYARFVELKISNHKSRIGSKSWYGIALVFFSLGLLSKPMLVTLPFVLLLLDFWPLQRMPKAPSPNSKVEDISAKQFWPLDFRPWTRLLLEKLPFFVLVAASSVVTFFAQRRGGAVVTLELYPLVPRLANALVSYGRYIAKTVWPKSLAVFYPYEGGWETWQIIGSVILLVTLSAVSIWLARRRPYLFVGWFWFVGMLVPVIGIVQVGAQSMADRYTYLPHIGLFISIVWFFSEWLKASALRVAQIVVGLLLLGCLAVSSVQVRHWRNTETLLTHTVAVTTGNPQAHYYLGFVLDSLGKTDEALAQYIQAVRIQPNFVDAHCNLGSIYARLDKPAQAFEEYSKALQLNSDFAPAHFGLAELFLKQKKKDDAKKHYEAGIRARPDFAEAHYQLAVLLAEERITHDAILHYKEAVRLKPDWLEALNNLAWILATNPDEKFRDGNLAVNLAERAVRLCKNKNPGVIDTLAAAYAETGRFSDATVTAENAATLAIDAKQMQFAAEIKERLKSYQSQRPFRE